MCMCTYVYVHVHVLMHVCVASAVFRCECIEAHNKTSFSSSLGSN